MKPLRGAAVVVAFATILALTAGPRAMREQTAQDNERIASFLRTFQQMLRDGDATMWRSLSDESANPNRMSSFAAIELRPGVTRVTMLERDREVLELPDGSTGYRLIVDALMESGSRGRAVTWRFDLTPSPTGFKVADTERLSSVDRLFRLSVTTTKQYTAHNFTLLAEDVELTLTDGSVFTVDTTEGVTGLVLVGRGVMNFHPAPPTEKGQLRVYANADKLESTFDAAFIRVGRVDFHADLKQLTERPVDARDLRRAQDVFREEAPKTYHVDFGDLTPDAWSMVPGDDDIVMEMRTRRFGTLTYSQSAASAEDISVFDRARQKNISVYTSKARLATRGRFYDDDDGSAFDVLDNEIDLTFTPERRWIDARARIHLKVRSDGASQIQMRLAESFEVSNVTSEEFGRLFSLRVRDHGTILINLPVYLIHDGEVTLTVTYSGRIPQGAEWEAPLNERDLMGGGPFPGPRLDPVYLISNRADWYPRPSTSDYATATLRITVPAAFDCIASGQPDLDSPTLIDTGSPFDRKKRFVFTAERPLRYLSFLVTRLSPMERATVAFSDDEGRARGPAMGGAVYDSLDLSVTTHPRLVAQASAVATQAADIAQFFRSLVGDSPYASLTLALLEGNTPAGHSPGYFAALRRPPKDAIRTWRNDPAAFDNYAEFFPAHEIAHQWWGQAVGWNTYHDQWLSEGFAQYFAAIYTKRERGDEAFRSIMRQMRKWAIDESDQGPVFLGYRLGHVHDEGRVFRALVYDKGAIVLHMLRRLMGDDAFFLGVRRFYANWRFQKASTEDLRHAMEAEAGRSLEQFFERWIYGSTLPQLTFSQRVESSASGKELVMRVEQRGELFDVPVTVFLQYSDQPTTELVIPVTERVTEKRVTLTGTLRGVELGKEDTLADIQRK